MKFLILGNMNAITHKEVFPLIKDGKVQLGYGHPKNFLGPDGELTKPVFTCWYTSLPHGKKNPELTLTKTYNPLEYPKYDNYDAIEVPKVKDIPMDWKGQMGVPITFLDKFNSDQFEILGNIGAYAPDGYSLGSAIYANGTAIYKRLVIRNKKPVGGKT
mgnify:CR=1 FL=1